MNPGGAETTSSGSGTQLNASGPFGINPTTSVGGTFHGTGGLAGGQLGYNYQTGNLVFGVEGEGYWSGMTRTYDSISNIYAGNTLYGIDSVHNQTKNKSDYTIAGRMGIAFDRTLIYGKAGWAWGKFDVFDKRAFDYANCGGTCLPGSFNSYSWGGTLNGPLFGIGIEYAITQNWTAKLEYNYIMFGASSSPVTRCASTLGSPTLCQPYGSSTLSADKQLFKFGLNYLFNAAGPVIARY